MRLSTAWVRFSGAPAELDVLGAFINSVDERTFGTHRPREEITGPVALAGWLAARGLITEGTKVSESDLRLALRLREGLRRAAAANRGEGDSASDLAEVAERLPLRAWIGPAGQIGLQPASGSATEQALAQIVAAAVIATANGTWRRVKMCAAPDCGVVFYDSSKPRTGRWCVTSICGNRYKTRTYRQRAKASERQEG